MSKCKLTPLFNNKEKEKLFYECCMRYMELETNEKIKKLQKRY